MTHVAQPVERPLRTPLYDLHQQYAASFIPFAGYEMPVQYAAGLMAEHKHTRSKAGLFDVSHMGQIELWPLDGALESVALALETLVPADIVGLPVGRQRYTQFTNPEGGILDDLMVANLGNRLVLVVNAACKHADLSHLRQHLSDQCRIESLFDKALIALQGPSAEQVLSGLAPQVSHMRFMDVREITLLGVTCLVSRSGYTGEDGYEISVPANLATELAQTLLQNPEVALIGLGARDSLRLEAGLCLYGADMDVMTTPVEAGLEWSIQKSRRLGGSRTGGFPGSHIILNEIPHGAPRMRVGLRPEVRNPIRGGTWVYTDDHAIDPIGTVTSGGFGPTLDSPVAMGMLDRAYAQIDRQLFAEVRGKRLPVRVCSLPFITPSYKRA